MELKKVLKEVLMLEEEKEDKFTKFNFNKKEGL